MKWIEHGRPWRVGPDQRKTLELIRGMLLVLANGKRLLVGDINKLGGVCDDCVGLRDDDVIVRYAIVPLEETP